VVTVTASTPTATRALAEAVEHSKGLLSQARPVLHQLRQLSNETALVVQLVGHSAICADRAEPTQAMRLTYQPGQAVSLQRGASARVLIPGLTLTSAVPRW
jgi:DNA-binding IclR family transcriptional regulator